MKRKTLLFTILTALMMVLMGCVTVSAAQKSNITLKANKVYKNYDITSNGINDEIFVSDGHVGGDYYISVYINGRNIWNKYAGPFTHPSIKLYTLKNGRNYMQIKCIGENDQIKFDYLVTYKNGVLINSANLKAHRKDAWLGRYDSKLKKIGSNYITFTMQTQPGGIGMIEYPVTYKQSGYSMKPSSTIYKLSSFKHPILKSKNKWTCARSVTIYTKAIKGKKVATLKSGQKVNVVSVYYSNGNSYIKISYSKNGKTVSGWAKCPNTWKNAFFKETIFV